MLHWRNPLIRMYKRGMEDADLERAVDLTIKCGFSLTGQAYTGASAARDAERERGVHSRTSSLPR